MKRLLIYTLILSTPFVILGGVLGWRHKQAELRELQRKLMWQARLEQVYGSAEEISAFSSLLNQYEMKFEDLDFTASALSPDGSKLITGDAKGNIIIWNANDLRPERILPSSQKNMLSNYFKLNAIKNIVFDPEHPSFFLVFDGYSVRVYNLSLGAAFVRQLDGIYGQSLDLNHQGIMAVGNSCYASFYRCDYTKVHDDDQSLGTAFNKVAILRDSRGLTFSPDDSLLAASSVCMGMTLTDLAAAQKQRREAGSENAQLDGEPFTTTLFGATEAEIYGLTFSKDSRLLAGVDIKNKQIFVLSAPDWTMCSAFRLNDNAEIQKPCHLSFSDDQHFLAMSMGSTQGYIFDLKRQQFMNTVNMGQNLINVSFIPGSTHLVTVDKSGLTAIWDTTNVVNQFQASADFDADLNVSLKWKPVFFPLTFEVSTSHGLKVSWDAEEKIVTPIGDFSAKVEIEPEIKTAIESAIAKKNLVVIIEDQNTGKEDCYSIEKGLGITAAISGNSTISIKEGIIHVTVAEPHLTVRFVRD